MSHLASPPGLLVTSEWHCRVEDVVAVDPDGTGAQLFRHAVRLADIARPHRSGQAVVAVVGADNDFLRIGERHCRNDRSEDFFLHDFHGFLRVHEHRGLNEVSAIARFVPTGEGLCAVGEPGLQVSANAI